MSQYDFTGADMAEMRREGTHLRFIRMIIRPMNQPPRPDFSVSSARPADHISGAWPAVAADGDPTRVVCDCEGCTALGADQPPIEDLLRTINQTDQPESA